MDKLKHMARQAERDTIVFTLRDGTIVQVYSDEFIDCLLHETDRGRRHYFGEDPGPPTRWSR
jgi:hypothetical protein